MNKGEARSVVEGAISTALKDYPRLQQGFEVICKENAELKKNNAAYKETLEFQQSCTMDRYFKLKKAKEIIKTFLGFADAFGYSQSMDTFISDTEQFLKEVE